MIWQEMFFTFVRYVLTARGREGVTVMSTNPLNGDTALHQACMHARWPVVSWLVAAGADPEVRGAGEWGGSRLLFFTTFLHDVFWLCLTITSQARGQPYHYKTSRQTSTTHRTTPHES